MNAEVLATTVLGRRRSLLWWTLGLGALVVITVAFYPSIRESAGLSDYAKDLPKGLRGLFAGGEIDIVSPAGYLNSQVFAVMAPLLILIFGIGLGAATVAGEEEKGTLDLLLAHPLKREAFVVQQFLASVVLITALSLALFATVALSSELFDLEIGLGKLAAASASVAILGLLFGSLALAVGAIWAGRARAIAVAAGISVAAWLLDGLGQAVDALGSWRGASPWYQAIGTNPLRNGAQWDHWAILVALTAVLVVLAAWGLARRDVRQ